MMLASIFRFEIKYWFRQPMLYIFFLVNAALVFGASASDSITIGSSTGNIHKNAPYVLENFYSLMTFLCLLMVTAFINATGIRDFSENTYQLFFTTPVSKKDYLFGKFFGAYLMSMLPFAGISVGNMLGVMMPWLDAELVGPTYLSAHLKSWLVFVIPNLFFVGSVLFCITVLFRSTLLSFSATIGLLLANVFSQALLGDMENETLAALFDPFGSSAFRVVTKYWTINDKNTLSAGLEGILLWNRLLWMGVGIGMLLLTYKKFSFSDKKLNKIKKANSVQTKAEEPLEWKPLPAVLPDFSRGVRWYQFRSQVSVEIKNIISHIAFIVIIILGFINLFSSLWFNTHFMGYGLGAYPATHSMISSISGSFYLFVVAIILFYSGLIVWKERDHSFQDICDTLPYPTWIQPIAKALALWVVVQMLLLIACIEGIVFQLLSGFSDIRMDEYLIQVMVLNGFTFLVYIFMGMFLHTLINNRYIAYFAFVCLIVANAFLWPAFDVESHLLRFASTPQLIYSDMNGFGPFLKGNLAFMLYWISFGSLLMLLAWVFWVRGRDTSIRIRWRKARSGFTAAALPFASLFMLWLMMLVYLFYQTRRVNHYVTKDEKEEKAAAYEKKYKKYERLPQPFITDVDFHIELYPEQRNLRIEAKQWIRNTGSSPIDTLMFGFTPLYESSVSIPGGHKILDDKEHLVKMYRLEKSLQPGDSIRILLYDNYSAKGIENEIGNTEIVENGTFFNTDVLPVMGYSISNELTDRIKRKKYGLPPPRRMPLLSRDPEKRRVQYIGTNADWVRVHSVFGTAANQTGIAPGSLIKKWKANGRNYFEYQLDHASLNFYSFLSAKYEVMQDTFQGISMEVYYDKLHPYNVHKMLQAMKHSVSYFEKNFGKYRHRQTRIIEFPRYRNFAQAFAGTMPYSEAIGFISKLEDPSDIDMVTYVVAHEMGHQWWAHQVMGANMQGSTFLSESMAQYSALMVMEKLYGKKQMHKFLKYEMDNYLRARGLEILREMPLLRVENQDYIHYNKAGVVMYYLKEMIGEKNVNAALHNLVDSFAYRGAPYPTSMDLEERLVARTPDSLKYLIRDWLHDITLFSNRTLEAHAKALPGNKYRVRFTVESNKFKADTLGRETEVPVNDWITVGIESKPQGKEEKGRVIWSKKVKVNSRKMEFTAVVNERPYKAGIDPDYYLIDRMPEDNMRKIDSE